MCIPQQPLNSSVTAGQLTDPDCKGKEQVTEQQHLVTQQSLKPMTNSNLLAAPKYLLIKIVGGTTGQRSSKDGVKITSSWGNQWIHHSNICKLRVERPLPLHSEYYHAFPFRPWYHQSPVYFLCGTLSPGWRAVFWKDENIKFWVFPMNHP